MHKEWNFIVEELAKKGLSQKETISFEQDKKYMGY